MVGKSAVLHLIPNDIYLDIKFLSWGQAGGGGFSYQRSTPVQISTGLVWNGGADGYDDHWTTAANWSGAPAIPGSRLQFGPLAPGGSGASPLLETIPPAFS